MKEKIYISIVIPTLNSENYLKRTIISTIEELNKIDKSYEIIIINDGSTDNTQIIIDELKDKFPFIKTFQFIKNYGQHSAMLCGIRNANGKYIVNMDDDLQNPPKEITKLIKKIEDGFDLVFAKFKKKNHSFIKNFGSKFINKVTQYIFNKPRDIMISNFRIFTREVANNFKDKNIKSAYIAGLLLLSASNISHVETIHNKSISDKSNYNLFKTFSLVSNIIFNYSVIPITIVSILGIVISFLSFIIGIYFIVNYIFSGVAVPGWTTIVVLISFFFGYLIMMLGIIGQYIAKIVLQTSDLDPYIVKKNEND
tara:strand:- start:1030 stop:1962 length:933 start_codon:yes stop_codon:yes gene_type:complete